MTTSPETLRARHAGNVGIATLVLVTSLVAVAVCMAGVASYHPEGARWARHSASDSVTSDMSVFSMGGVIGYAVGPLVVAAVLAPLGLPGTAVIAVIPMAAAVLVFVALRRFRRQPAAGHDPSRQTPATASEWRPFILLLALFCLASGVTTGLLTYLPLFLVQARAASPAASNVMTSVLLAAAAAGTLLGGIAAQRLGRRFVLLVPQLVLVPAIALLPSLGYAGMLPVVVLIGIAMNANLSIALVLAQEYLPAHMGLATGLTIGLCSGLGGLIVAGLGLLGDAAGPSAVLYVIAALPPRGGRARVPAAAAGRRSAGHRLDEAGRSDALSAHRAEARPCRYPLTLVRRRPRPASPRAAGTRPAPCRRASRPAA